MQVAALIEQRSGRGSQRVAAQVGVPGTGSGPVVACQTRWSRARPGGRVPDPVVACQTRWSRARPWCYAPRGPRRTRRAARPTWPQLPLVPRGLGRWRRGSDLSPRVCEREDAPTGLPPRVAPRAVVPSSRRGCEASPGIDGTLSRLLCDLHPFPPLARGWARGERRDALTADGRPDKERVLALAARHGIEITGPLPER